MVRDILTMSSACPVLREDCTYPFWHEKKTEYFVQYNPYLSCTLLQCQGMADVSSISCIWLPE